MLLIYSLQQMSLLAMLAGVVRYTEHLEGLSDIERQAPCSSDGFTKDPVLDLGALSSIQLKK